MFLRPNHRSKDGKGHTYWSLVETVRTADGPRQKTLCYTAAQKFRDMNNLDTMRIRKHGRPQNTSAAPRRPNQQSRMPTGTV